MNSNNIFIVGANGQLGRALRHQYPEAKFADIDEMDITDRQSVESFDWSGISIVLNAAASVSYTHLPNLTAKLTKKYSKWSANRN